MGASTIVVVQEDFTIPGAAANGDGAACTTADQETHFFNVVRQHNPDVIVLDLTGSPRHGSATIQKIRHRTGVPILVVCDPDDPLIREYSLAGAVETMPAPVDIGLLNQTVQQIIRLTESARVANGVEPSETQPISFSGLTLHPHENRLVGADGAIARLTTSENLVLVHFVSNPWTLCTRDALAEVLYGNRRPNSDRAVDVIVTRLRKKIAELGGPAAQRVIKTEFRRGYVFVAPVQLAAAAAAAERMHARTA